MWIFFFVLFVAVIDQKLIRLTGSSKKMDIIIQFIDD